MRDYRGGIKEWTENRWPTVSGTGPYEAMAPHAGASGDASAGHLPVSRGVSPHRLPVAAHGWADRFVDAFERHSTGQLIQSWAGMIFLCAVIYWAAGVSSSRALVESGRPVPFDLGGLVSALYFSFVTATSVGYGDIVPIGFLRALAVAEAAAGLLIFGAVIAKFVSRRQERLVEETHRLAFEDRLDRVLTNLHLVLSDLQGIAVLCDEGRVSEARIRARLESAVLVFAAEMRAIHDLLYRPQQTPDEQVLEGILSSLAASLQELVDLLACGAPAERTAILSKNLSAMSRLADEICGDCVPKVYAEELRGWMDRVKKTSALLR